MVVNIMGENYFRVMYGLPQVAHLMHLEKKMIIIYRSTSQVGCVEEQWYNRQE